MAQSTDTELQQIKDLIHGLDKKIDLKFADTDVNIQALSKKTELSFAEVNGKLDVINTRLIGIKEKIKVSEH
jgi:hypothetical protein